MGKSVSHTVQSVVLKYHCGQNGSLSTTYLNIVSGQLICPHQ